MPARDDTNDVQSSDKPKFVMRTEVVEEGNETVKPVQEAVKEARPVEVSDPAPVAPAVVVEAEPAAVEPEKAAAGVSGLARLPLSTVQDIAESAGSRNSKGWGWIWVGLAFAVGISAGAVGIYFGKPVLPPELPRLVEAGDQTPPAGPSPTAAPSPTPELKRAGLTVQILNGSGVRGRAAEAKQLLEDLKYVVAATGNADADDYQKAEVAIKADKKDFGPALVADLKSKYSVEVNLKTLDAGSKYDAVIVLGKDLAQ